MSWLGGRRIAAEVSRALALGAGDPVTVFYDRKLASRLSANGQTVTEISDEVPAPVECASVVVVGSLDRDASGAGLSRLVESMRGDGMAVLVDRVTRPVASKAALLAGLSRISQASVGRVVITCGRRIGSRSQASPEN